MLKAPLLKALNDQINAESYSAYLYMAMAAYFAERNLPGMANWMEVQAKEELFHASRFFQFVHERGGKVVFGAIDAPPSEWGSPVELFAAVLEHERHVSDLIDNLVDLALANRDHATNNFLQWFVGEQVEEEATAEGVLERLKLAEGSAGGILLVDQELGQRVFTPPVVP